MRTLLGLGLLLVGCDGTMILSGTGLDAGDEVDAGVWSTAALSTPEALGPTGLQRLTQRQLTRASAVLFGVTPDVATLQLAPADSPSSTAFDNDVEALTFSLQLITDYEAFAWAFAGQVKSNVPAFVARAGCTPMGPSDELCFKRYVANVGRLVLRRTVDDAEQRALARAFLPIAIADGNFMSAVELVVATWLQHPEFLYRIEAGSPTPGAPVALSQQEIAVRLAFLATGLPPDALLLDAAETGALASPQGRALQVQRLLATPDAVAHGQYLHSRWLGFADRLFPANLAADARLETNALVEQLVTDPQRDWMSLFTADETFVTPSLAAHYGLPSPGVAARWVKAPPERAAGVLSHATFAALGAKFGDTSPTLRGYEAIKRLLCGSLPGDIPDGVDVTAPPGDPSACKPQRYAMRTTPGCQGCHERMDPIGLGLEQLGSYGEWRMTEPNKPGCTISGEGALQGQPFVGPAALGRLLAKEPLVARCAGQHLFESLNGRKADPADGPTLDALYAQYRQTRSYGSLVLSLARSPAITFKTTR
ncbi:MAG: DUF1592 domain-containing protein [Myxococcaceae bacterium]|nr:DUF1592 domain-containing protein [Myxococcaceae bacterium]